MPDLKQDRRYSDHVKHASDHDIIIGYGRDIQSLCKITDKIDKKLDSMAERDDDRCNLRVAAIHDKIDRRVTSATFWKLFGVIMLCLMTLYGTVGLTVRNTEKNKGQIAINTECIKGM